MKYRKSNYTSNEFKVIQMLWINVWIRVDLQSVIVVGRVLKQTVEWIKHFMWKQIEKFPINVTLTDNLKQIFYLETPP